MKAEPKRESPKNRPPDSRMPQKDRNIPIGRLTAPGRPGLLQG
jgi:hypothetical protein